MVENWNACLREARGEYIKYLFGDDLLASPDALQKMVGVLDSDRTVSLVASARNLIDERLRKGRDGLLLCGQYGCRRVRR